MSANAERMKAGTRTARAERNKRRKGKLSPDEHFVQLAHGLLDEPAWKALRPGARVLYVAVKRYYNGQNNGRVFLSIRKAADDTGLSRGSVERHLQELIDKGFIRPAVKGHLGVLGKGQATSWILTEIGVNGARPTKDFRAWQPPEKQNPVIRIGTGCHQNRDRKPPKCHHHEDRCHHHEDRKTPKSGRACHQNGDTSTLIYQGAGAGPRTFAVVEGGVPVRHGVKLAMGGSA